PLFYQYQKGPFLELTACLLSQKIICKSPQSEVLFSSQSVSPSPRHYDPMTSCWRAISTTSLLIILSALICTIRSIWASKRCSGKWIFPADFTLSIPAVSKERAPGLQKMKDHLDPQCWSSQASLCLREIWLVPVAQGSHHQRHP